MQIFLAVAVLVYSAVIGAGQYELRSARLQECGDKLKMLSTQLGLALNETSRLATKDVLEYQRQYFDILSDSEPHNIRDFQWVAYETNKNSQELDKNAKRRNSVVRPWLKSRFFRYIYLHLAAWMMLAFEFVFILDMLGITRVFTPYLSGVSG